MSRPQVHGYELTCVSLLPKLEHEHRLVSGGDEKLLRAFDATYKVLNLLQDLCGCRLHAPARAETAYTPALGLSNKAVTLRDETGGDGGLTAEEKRRGQMGEDDGETIFRARTKITWERPPIEGELVDHTMWPEVAKVYGHLNGLTCLAVSHDGEVLAAACKAREPVAASLRLWDTSKWLGYGPPLPGHQSTVVQLEFSYDSNVLVSVSKDRQICVFGRKPQERAFQLLQTVPKAHKRIIWTCSWSHDDRLLATGSRDGTIKVWQVVRAEGGPMQIQLASTSTPKSCQAGAGGDAASVTAVAFAPRMGGAEGREYLLAIGMEVGRMELWGCDGNQTWSCRHIIDPSLSHAAGVRRLKWRPLQPDSDTSQDGGAGQQLYLASAGSDHAVRITAVKGF